MQLCQMFVSVLGSWVLPCIAYCGFSKTFRGAEVLCVVSIFIASLPVSLRALGARIILDRGSDTAEDKTGHFR